MYIYKKNQNSCGSRRLISTVLLIAFGLTSFLPPNLSWAQVVPLTGLNLPIPGTVINLSPAFIPAHVTGIAIHPDDPFKFDFIIDTGDDHLEGEAFKQESMKLIKYFMASLTVPENQMWVNLSPYEKNRIIADGLGQTEMGRDMLGQDYILKQLTASLMSPENEWGQKFWDRVHKEVKEKYGNIDIPTDTFNKIWILPDKASVYVHDNRAFVVENHLKVMLEEDYVALSNSHPEGANATEGSPKRSFASTFLNGFEKKLVRTDFLQIELRKSQYAALRMTEPIKEILKEILLPEIEKEVNNGKNFAQLRQIFYSMILATWYKQNLKKSLFTKNYANQNKIEGIDLQDKKISEKIYNQYLEAFQKGVSNLIKEEYDPQTQEVIPRKYFSGGVQGVEDAAILTSLPSSWMEAQINRDHAMVTAGIDPLGPQASDEAMVTYAEGTDQQYLKRLDKMFRAIAGSADVDGSAYKDFQRGVSQLITDGVITGLVARRQVWDFMKSVAQGVASGDRTELQQLRFLLNSPEEITLSHFMRIRIRKEKTSKRMIRVVQRVPGMLAHSQALLQDIVGKIKRNEPVKICFVCNMNVHRSAVAHVLVMDQAQKLGRTNVEIVSGGTFDSNEHLNSKLRSGFKKILEARGVDSDIINRFRTRDVTKEDLEDSQLIVIAEPMNLERLSEFENEVPGLYEKMIFFTSINPVVDAQHPDHVMPDPYDSSKISAEGLVDLIEQEIIPRLFPTDPALQPLAGEASASRKRDDRAMLTKTEQTPQALVEDLKRAAAEDPGNIVDVLYDRGFRKPDEPFNVYLMIKNHKGPILDIRTGEELQNWPAEQLVGRQWRRADVYIRKDDPRGLGVLVIDSDNILTARESHQFRERNWRDLAQKRGLIVYTGVNAINRELITAHRILKEDGTIVEKEYGDSPPFDLKVTKESILIRIGDGVFFIELDESMLTYSEDQWDKVNQTYESLRKLAQSIKDDLDAKLGPGFVEELTGLVDRLPENETQARERLGEDDAMKLLEDTNRLANLAFVTIDQILTSSHEKITSLGLDNILQSDLESPRYPIKEGFRSYDIIRDFTEKLGKVKGAMDGMSSRNLSRDTVYGEFNSCKLFSSMALKRIVAFVNLLDHVVDLQSESFEKFKEEIKSSTVSFRESKSLPEYIYRYFLIPYQEALAEREAIAEPIPDEALLAHPEDLVGGEINLRYLRRIQKIVNSSKADTKKIAMYVGAGADISAALLAIDATDYIFIDQIPFDTDKRKVSAKTLARDMEIYFHDKMGKGYGNYLAMKSVGRIRPFFIKELELLGIDPKDVSIKKDKNNPNVFRISFEYKGQRRTVTYVGNADATRPAKFASLIKRLGRADFLMIRAGNYSERNPKPLLTRTFVMKHLKPSGHLIVDSLDGLTAKDGLRDLVEQKHLRDAVLTRLERDGAGLGYGDRYAPQSYIYINNLDEALVTDKAVTSEVPGGIDFNPANMNFNSNGDKIQINLPMADPAMLGVESPVRGYQPVIIEITPITNFPLLLGLKDEHVTQISYN